MRVLRNVEDISQCMLTQRDVVRHVLVQRIIDAYEKSTSKKDKKKNKAVGMINHVIEVVSELDIDISEFELLIKECVNKTLVFEDIRFPCEVCVLLTDNAGIRELNLTYRKLDKPTDVLSFPCSSPTRLGSNPARAGYRRGYGHVMLGDIVISAKKRPDRPKN